MRVRFTYRQPMKLPADDKIKAADHGPYAFLWRDGTSNTILVGEWPPSRIERTLFGSNAGVGLRLPFFSLIDPADQSRCY